MTQLWRNNRGDEVVTEPRRPEVVYNVYTTDNHYLGPMTEAQLKRNGFQEVSLSDTRDEES